MGIQEARAQPVTILTPVRRWWGLWLLFSWPGAERFRPVAWIVHRPLLRLRFIHFAHWSLMRRIPQRHGKRLPFPVVVFNTNYNGDINAYLDAFSIMVPWRMRGLWHGAYGFPGPMPLGPFREYVMSRAILPRHYFCAYPDESAKTIVAGLELQDHFSKLARDAPGLTPEQFAARWDDFLTDHGMLL